jgi:hypothetical protein
LVSAALSNPLEFFTVEETGIILGDFTPALMTAIIKAGAPMVNRRMNPHTWRNGSKCTHGTSGR